jgi:hypothetical protein
MGYTRIKQQDHNNTYYTEFAIDSVADLANLPTDASEVAAGSAAICIENSEVYMLNSNREWVML